MPTSSIRATASIALACALAGVVLLVLLGHRSLAEWDEAIYAEVAREMLPDGAWRGGWMTPHWNYQLWLEKPPLLMWLTALMYRTFGVSEFTSRAVSALAGIGLVGLMHAWVLKRFDALSGWLATLALLASFGFQHASRVGETDVLLSLWLFVAMIGLIRSLAAEAGGILLFCGAFALALMTKGAASLILLPVAIATLMLDRSNRVRLVREAKLEMALGTILFLAITVPWHAWMWFHFRGEFTQTYLSGQVLDRIQRPIEGHVTHTWFYLWVLFVSAPFVSLAYFPALVAAWRDERLYVLRPFAVFVLAELGLFTLVRTRLPHYICPVYAPLSALSGIWAAGRLRSLGLWNHARRMQLIVAMIACTLFVTFTACTAAARRELHSPRLADGSIAPAAHESAKLLKAVFRSGESSAGVPPLLIWRQGQFVPIASEIFYSRGPVLQVSRQGPLPQSRVDKYVNDPVPIQSAIGVRPHFLLIQKSLLDQLPPELRFTPMSVGPSLELGLVTHVSSGK